MFDVDPIRATSRALAERLPELTALVRRRLREKVPTYAADLDPALSVHETERIAAALQSFSDGISGTPEPNEDVIREATSEARSAAQAGLDLNSLIQTYRVAQAVIWDVVLTETASLIPDPDQQLIVQKHMSQFHFRWNDTVVSAVVRAYQDEQRRFFFQSRDRRLRSALRELIAGRTDALPDVAYPLAATHLAAVVWGDRPERTIQDIATAAGTEVVLSVESISATTLAWFALDDHMSAQERLRAGFVPAIGTGVAFGRLAAGLAGFRTTHHQAWRAYRVGWLTNSPVTHYADIALEALFLRDLQATRDLVTQELGPLDLSDPRTELLCETMRVYFAAGCNAAKAATQLQVHERTVAYRLRTVEERLGMDVISRRNELVVALRLLTALRAISSTTSPVGPVVRI
ncbi:MULTISPECIES: PucR family transcriptional regulator [Amycolatopsis]|uniref:PucR family transcriptional regulator n=1 Tax=Amycolatopsis TaxID=1813 RepID=UPI0003AACBBE|nr:MULTISPECIES: helix-turn-helix domain-containing protein [Amycolatopsis]